MTHTAHIQTLRHEADEVIWQRFDALLRPFRGVVVVGNPKEFESVIRASCKPPQGDKLDDVISRTVDSALRQTKTRQEAADRIGVTRSWLYWHLKRRKAVVA